MKRDISQATYERWLRQSGIGPATFLGYRDVGSGLHVSELNAGPTRRERLAYLIRKQSEAAIRAKEKEVA